MNRSEGIAMADEQNQGNTIINQGTTIDNLPGLDGMTPAQKQEFIDSAFVPIRGTISGEMATRKVTGSDLAASGENKIDSIAVAGTTIEPVNKHVNIPLATTTAAGVMSANDKTKLDELKGVPDPTIFAASGGDVLTLDNNGNARWSPPPTPEIDSISVDETVLDIDANKNVNIPLGDGLVYDADGGGVHTLHAKLDGSGGIEASSEGHLYVSATLPLYTYDEPKNSIFLGYDETLALNDDGDLVVATPVPPPGEDTTEGDILTYDGNGIVWAQPPIPNIDSISVGDTPIEPVAKNVNIPLATTTTAGAMSADDKELLDNMVNITSISEDLDLDTNGELQIVNPVPSPPGDDGIYNLMADSDGIGWYTRVYYRAGDGLDSDSAGDHLTFNVKVPVPDPEWEQAADGAILSYSTSDGIVWQGIDNETIVNTNGTFKVSLNDTGGIASDNGGLYVALDSNGVIRRSSDGIAIGFDDTITTVPDDYGRGQLSVAFPVPEPPSEGTYKLVCQDGNMEWVPDNV